MFRTCLRSVNVCQMCPFLTVLALSVRLGCSDTGLLTEAERLFGTVPARLLNIVKSTDQNRRSPPMCFTKPTLKSETGQNPLLKVSESNGINDRK